ncbi:PilZ domain-containing protein [Desulfacinum hydrothermale DSM 13146]|uniref:PilZ domain-containing protein n=1 Tax=Desulfacinum hydrothermale DSM 13146 TaxID=1121390 RepID=A0A1W1XUL5_9BACT|nr:PilZ domain-containing protein [Desulfacinum hydrothermale]SMC27587.1 PilZ domain-containing protein [Desulfacinum hydrothermale DSM 13146]
MLNGSNVDGQGPDKRPKPCQVAFVYGEKKGMGKSVHFNERGMLVLCAEPAPIQTRIRLSLNFPGLRNPIEVEGEVVWSNLYGTDDTTTPRGMGIKFTQLDPSIARVLGDLSLQYRGYGTQYEIFYT